MRHAKIAATTCRNVTISAEHPMKTAENRIVHRPGIHRHGFATGRTRPNAVHYCAKNCLVTGTGRGNPLFKPTQVWYRGCFYPGGKLASAARPLVRGFSGRYRDEKDSLCCFAVIEQRRFWPVLRQPPRQHAAGSPDSRAHGPCVLGADGGEQSIIGGGTTALPGATGRPRISRRWPSCRSAMRRVNSGSNMPRLRKPA